MPGLGGRIASTGTGGRCRAGAAPRPASGSRMRLNKLGLRPSLDVSLRLSFGLSLRLGEGAQLRYNYTGDRIGIRIGIGKAIAITIAIGPGIGIA